MRKVVVKRAAKPATEPIAKPTEGPKTDTIDQKSRVVKPQFFPKPPAFKCPPEKFFAYWKGLPPECLDRVAMYVYATWPVLNHIQALSPEEQKLVMLKKKQAPTTNIAKPDKPFESDDYEGEILHRWGSGNYHFKLNDVGVKGNPEFPPKQICMCDVTRLENPEYPPVREMRLIDMSHPDNASYIAKLRLQGVKFPGDEVESAIAHEEEEMANVQSVQTLADTVRDMAKEAVDSAKSSRTQQPADPAALAGAKIVEIMGEGTKHVLDTMSQALQKVNEAQAHSRDPKQYISDLKDVAQMMKPDEPAAKSSDDSAMRDMIRMQHESHIASMDAINKRLESSEAWSRSLLEKLLAKPAEPPSASTIDKPKSFIHQIKELAEVKDVLRDLLGGESDDTPWYAAVGLRALDTIAGNATNFMHNLAVARSGMGAPVAPPEGEAATETTEQPAARPAQPSKDAIIVTVLTNLRAPLMEALTTGVAGFDFAAWLVMQNGNDRLYNVMAAEGKQGLFNLMQKHPQLWGETRAHATRLDAFADEFLDQEKVAAAIQLARSSNAMPHVTPTNQPPASTPKPNGPVRPIIGADGKPIQHTAPQVNRGASAGE